MNKNIYAVIMWLAVGWLACHAFRGAGAETYYVATNGVDTQSGIGGWANAVLTISNAVKKATTINDTVLVSNGTYLLDVQITVSSQITVRGWNNGIVDSTNTIVNGNAGNRCFYMTHTGAVVEGFTIYNGKTNYGGGVYMSAGTLRNCIVVSNSAQNSLGGGIYIGYNSTSVVDNCLIAYNVATNGGGISTTSDGGGLLVTNCVIRNNRAVSTASNSGGGVWMRTAAGGTIAIMANCSVYSNEATYSGGGILTYGACIVKNCVISNNFSAGNGGGVKLYSGALITNCVIVTNVCNTSGGGISIAYGGTIKNCVIAHNRATNEASVNNGGGGIFTSSSGGNDVIQDCIIEENTAGFYGGGIYYDGGTVRNCLIRNNVASGANGGIGGGLRLYNANLNLINCTIVSNYAKGSGTTGTSGGGFISSPGATYTQTIENCIIYYNDVGSYPAQSNYYLSGATCLSNNCLTPAVSGVSTNYSTNNITVDPQFVARVSGNYHLARGSPCANTGVNRNWMSGVLDLDGRRRLDKFSGVVDIGCYERVPSGTIYGVR